MVENILSKTAEAKAILEKVKKQLENGSSREQIEPLMKKAVCCKLMIPEDETDDLRKLSVLSIKYQDQGSAALPDSVIRSRIEKYDCHQTNLVTQKKTLLIMFIEKQLGVHFSDEDAVEIHTVSDLCQMSLNYQKGR